MSKNKNKQSLGPSSPTQNDKNQSTSSISTKDIDEGLKLKFALQWTDVNFRINA